MNNIFAHNDYKKYLNAKLDELDDGGRGSRARMSKEIGCQTAYTAQVLRGSGHFSLEHAEAINDFLAHTEEQGLFFLLLVQHARAGTEKLRARFKKQIQAALEGQALLKNRLGVTENLSAQNQVIYYSSWIFGAVHALVSIPGYQTHEAIAKHLDISKRQAADALEFLLQSNLLTKDSGGRIKIGKARIHLGADSPLIGKHHINWRLQAIRSIENQILDSLHYSSVVSLSADDFRKVREMLIESIQKIRPVIDRSKEEHLGCFNIDLFRI